MFTISLVEPDVVIMTACDSACDDKDGSTTTLKFHCINICLIWNKN